MARPPLHVHAERGSDRSDQLTRACYAAPPPAEPAPIWLEDVGFSVMAVLTSMLVGAIALA